MISHVCYTAPIYSECLTDYFAIKKLPVILSVKVSESHQFFSSSLLLINSPTQSSDFNLLNSLCWRHQKTAWDHSLIFGIYVYTCFLASHIKKTTFWKPNGATLITRENGYCLECDYHDHKVELTSTTLKMNKYYVYVHICFLFTNFYNNFLFSL